MADVADDEGREDEEQRDHRERCGCPHHLWGEEKTHRWEKSQNKSFIHALNLKKTLIAVRAADIFINSQ